MDLLRKPKQFFSGRVPARPLPDNLWIKCEKCHELSYVKEFEKNGKVCGKCGHHFRLSARERIAMLVDEGTFTELHAHLHTGDPLSFVAAGKTYVEKLAEVQEATQLDEAAICGYGAIGGRAAITAVLDFGFLAASMGSVVGEKVTRAVEEAVARRLPLLVVAASGGARMHEGILSLMQMAKTAAALARLSEERLPFISLLTDPTTGGVTASFASLGDIIIAEPGALIGFAGPRIIEQITRQKLPAGFQTAEFGLEHGMIDMVVPRRELKETIAGLLRLYGNKE